MNTLKAMTLVGALLALSPWFNAPASAEMPKPVKFGQWQVRCFSGISGDGKPSCHIDWSLQRWGDRGVQANLRFKLSSGFEEHERVVSSGLNASTCKQVELREQIYRGYDPINTKPTERDLNVLTDRIITVLRSHAKMFGLCTPMLVNVGPFPIGLFEDSLPDLAKAIRAVESGWTAHRLIVNPHARANEPRD